MATNVKFRPSEAFFIKLGEGGKYEQECIKVNQTVRLGFRVASHESCLNEDWEDVRNDLKNAGYKKINDAIRQIKCFYKSGEDVLWITFHGDRLWWCFSKQTVYLHPDGSRLRPVIGKWESTDINGEPLNYSRLSGKLLKVQHYRGTICSINPFDYLVGRIRGEVGADVAAAKKALDDLERGLKVIVQNLDPKDFEMLVDLIFRQTGWRRESVLGENLKTLDLVVSSPLTTKRYGVQVKTEASLIDYEQYKGEFGNMGDFDCFYFAVHTPDAGLQQVEDTEQIKLLLPEQIAHLTVKFGLVDWVIDKAG